jgi:hypothetical protein
LSKLFSKQQKKDDVFLILKYRCLLIKKLATN